MRPPHRATRGWLLALSSTGLAIAGHGVAGGGFPDLGIAVPLTALLAWVGAALADRLRRLVPLIIALGAIQLGLHLLLTEVVGAHGGHHAGSGGPAPVDDLTMLAGHALATVVTAALLAKASAALSLGSAALNWLRGQLSVPRPVPVAAAHPIPISAAPARPGVLLEILLRRVRSRRGPPATS